MSANEITNLKRKLTSWELKHLRQHAAELSERLERAEDDRTYYRELAEFWHEETMRLIAELQEVGAEIGIDRNGSISVTQPKATKVDGGEQAQAKAPRNAHLIDITPEQREALEPVFADQRKNGGAIISQVWRDGIRVALVTEEERERIAVITGAGSQKRFASAIECHKDASDRRAFASEKPTAEAA